MRFVLDVHVSSALHDFLVERGHEVFRVHRSMFQSASDEELVAVAHQRRAVIITWNRKHFRRLITRDPRYRSTEFPDASLISCQCRHGDAVRLFGHFLPVLEFEFDRRQLMDDHRLIAELDHDGLMLR